MLAQNGARVIGTATKIPNELKNGVSEWKQVDYSDARSLSDFCRWVSNLDQIEGCINNAGINIIKPLLLCFTVHFETCF